RELEGGPPPPRRRRFPALTRSCGVESCGERAARRKSLSYRPKCLTLDSLLATLSATRFRPPSSGLTTLDVEEAIWTRRRSNPTATHFLSSSDATLSTAGTRTQSV